ncbi:hypothetical protein CSUI_004324, partial [Cystoisospora suis]
MRFRLPVKVTTAVTTAAVFLLSVNPTELSAAIQGEPTGSTGLYTDSQRKGNPADRRDGEYAETGNLHQPSSRRLIKTLQSRRRQLWTSAIHGRSRPQSNKISGSALKLLAAVVIGVAFWRLAAVVRVCFEKSNGQTRAGSSPRSLSGSDDEPDPCADLVTLGGAAIPLSGVRATGDGEGEPRDMDDSAE